MQRKNNVDRNNIVSNKHAILIDFDGTITKNDVTDDLLNRFGSPDWTVTGELYLQGKITHAQMNKKFAELLRASSYEIDNYLKKTVNVRKGFNEFIKFSRNNQLRVIVVSSGWDYYIRNILSDYHPVFISDIDQLTKLSNSSLPVISNKLDFDGSKWKLTLKWDHLQCKLSSPCKAEIIKLLKSVGTKYIISIGNSESDYCMAEMADIVFSTGSLTQICARNKINANHFNDFYDLMNIFMNMV